MKTETKQIHRCDHCRKVYFVKSACESHEKRCTKNPEYLRPCHNCAILKKVSETIWSGVGDPYGGELERRVNVLFCEKLDSFIYPPSVAAKGNRFDMGDKSNIEMPKECEFYEDQFGLTQAKIDDTINGYNMYMNTKL